MTEEELEKKAEEYAGSFEWTNDDRIIDYSKQGFIAGAKSMQEENNSLKKQIEKLKCCQNCADGESCENSGLVYVCDKWRFEK